MSPAREIPAGIAAHIPPPGRLYQEMHVFKDAKPQDENQASHLNLWFENELPASAITVLWDILNASVSPTAKTSKIIPSPVLLGLITTLMVHPDLTTSHKNIRENTRASQLAYHYLHDFLRIVNPADAKLDQAWKFKSRPGARRAPRAARGNARTGQKFDGEDEFVTPYASTESLFTQTDDFWDVVGWAFTCSVEHKRRWEWYCLLLRIFLDAFEADWHVNVEKSPQDALLVKFLPNSTSSGLTKVCNAIFANGGDSAAPPCKEIWPHELNRSVLHNKTDDGIDRKDLFGRKLEEERQKELAEEAARVAEIEAELGENSTGKGKKKAPAKTHIDASGPWGGMDALMLRMRFLNLLMSVCYTQNFVPLIDLLGDYGDILARLPAPQFLLFLGGNFDRNPSMHLTTLEYVIEKWLSTVSPVFTNLLAPSPKVTKKRSMRDLEEDDVIVVGREKKKGRGSLPGQAELSEKPPPLPKPRIDKDVNTGYGHLTQKKFAICYAPFAATTDSASDNMRLAIVLEIMLRTLFVENGLEYDHTLEDAIRQGILAREEKVQQGLGKKRRGKQEDGNEMEYMQRMQIAHRCMLHVLALAKAKAGTPPVTPTTPTKPREMVFIQTPKKVKG